MPSSRIELLIKHHEGFREKPYRDSTGHLTIGWGYNLEAGLPIDVLNDLFGRSLHQAFLDARRYPWFEGLSDVRRAVIVDMLYCLGAYRFATFKRMIAAMAQGDWALAAEEIMDSRYATQVGRRASRLAEMMERDEWPSYPQLSL